MVENGQQAVELALKSEYDLVLMDIQMPVMDGLTAMKELQQHGYTQPVVTWKNDKGIEVIDGFHRTRVCKELKDVNKRVHGYLPVVNIQGSTT